MGFLLHRVLLGSPIFGNPLFSTLVLRRLRLIFVGDGQATMSALGRPPLQSFLALTFPVRPGRDTL